MPNFQDLLAKFKLNDDLKTRFLDFETYWGTKKASAKPYSIITIVNNDITDQESELHGGNRAELA